MENQAPTREPLQQAEARAAAVVHAALDAIVTIDHEGAILDFNPAAERLFGFPRAEVLGREMAALVIRAPELLERQRERLRHSLTTAEGPVLGQRLEMAALRADGSELPVELTVIRLPTEGPPIFTGFIRDLSTQKQAEQAARDSEERFRSAFDDTNVATVLTDLDHRFVRVNAAFARLFGYAPAELLRLSMPEITHPDDLAESYARREALNAGAVRYFEMEKRYLHKDGHVLWGLVNVSLVRDRDGQPLLYVGQVQDITERKRTEEALGESERRFRHLFESNPHVMWVYDPATLAFLAVNDAAIAAYGHSREELLAMTVEDLLPPDEAARLRRELAKGPGRLYRSGTWRFRRKDGSFLEVEATSHSLVFAGRPARFVLAQDVSERRRLEAQLLQAQKMEAVGRLAGGVAHDFNNLLTVITGYGELLLSSLPPGDPNRELIREMTTAGERAAGLTRQLLAFSRKAILAPRVLDLKVVVADMDKLLQRVIGEDIHLVSAMGPDLGLVKADPGQLEQVILNLAINARDAMPRGGRLTIEVRNADLDDVYADTHPDARAGPHVLLAVSDTGCGMDAATMRVFEPFFSTKGEQGTGLGLATVYGIIKQSGGHVGVYSELRHGSTFKVYLPRAEEKVPSGRAQTSPTVMPSGTETVLLVEDEDGVRALARHVLAGCGYKVLEARDGAEALEIAGQSRERIALLVTDVVMPRLGGRETAERLMGSRPGLKVLFLSGYTDDAIVRHGVLEAEVQFLQKPFSPVALAQKVRTTLDHLEG